MQEGIDDSLMDTGAGVPILEETYPVSPPFSYVLIQTDPISKRTTYMVVEIPLDNKEQAIYKKILDIMIEELDIERDKLNQEKAEEFLKKKIVDIIKRYRISLNESQFEKIMYYLSRDLIGYGKIQPLMLDPNIEDISNDGVGVPIYVWHRKYESIATNVVFEDEGVLDSFIIKMAQRANRHVSIANPLLDASLPDGSRVQLSYGKEVTQRGSTFTIRKFKADPFTISDLILYNTIDLDIAAYYWYVMEHNVSILVAGGTAAGKTTLLNTLAMMIKPNMKVVTIEDSVTPDSEMLIKKDNSLVRVTIGDLVDEMIDKYPSRKLDSGHEVCSINPENIEIQSMQNESIKFTPITSFIRHKINKKIYQVITSTGRRIKVTGDHSLFTLDENCKVTQIATRDLRIGDKIATPRSLESSKTEVEKVDLLDHLKHLTNTYVIGSPVKKILKKYKNELINHLGLNIHTYRWRLKKSLLSCKDFYKLIRYYNLNLLASSLDNIVLRSKNGLHTLPPTLSLTDEFLEMIGLWLAEGSYDKHSILITNTETPCRNLVNRVAIQLGLHVKDHSDGATMMLNSSLLRTIFKNVLNLKGHANTKRIPNWVFNLSNRQICLILKGLFSGDGSVNKHEICLTSQSLGLLKDVQTLLLKLDILSHISKNKYKKDQTFRLRISSISNLVGFKDQIGFIQTRKLDVLKTRITNREMAHHSITDTIPISNKMIETLEKLDIEKKFHFKTYKNNPKSNIGRNYLDKILEYYGDQSYNSHSHSLLTKMELTATSDILWDKIVSIEELDSKFNYVYDLSVSEMENFVCENIVVHNTAELNLAHENWIPSVVRSGFGEASETGFRRGQISMYELLRAAMRQRPDYIIVGEIRGSEAYAMFQAMSTGHRGLGTIHGDSVEGVIHRLESKPMDIPRSMMKSLDIIHVIRKVRHKSKFARRTMAITEIIGLDPVTEELLTNKIYQWNAREDAYINFGRSYVIEKILENTGDTEREVQEEMERRKTILRWMTKKRVRYFEDVASILQEYYADPDSSLEKARKGLKG